jgi:glycosyltransferase involved in cell wall biosynthesis
LNIDIVRPDQGAFPRSGTLVIGACYFPIGDWIASTNFRRIVLVYNVCAPNQLLPGTLGIELLPAGAESVSEFLQTLDCFVYRTHPSESEALGRTVTEAMAIGLPVVVLAAGGYREIIEQDVNGIVFHSD